MPTGAALISAGASIGPGRKMIDHTVAIIEKGLGCCSNLSSLLRVETQVGLSHKAEPELTARYHLSTPRSGPASLSAGQLVQNRQS